MDTSIVENEIYTRRMLQKKVAIGAKLTKEEKCWIETHREFSTIFGYPVLKRDIIELDEKKKYQFRIVFLDSSYQLMINPYFDVPCLEGDITTDRELYNFAGKKSKAKSIKMLVTFIDREKPEFIFQYQSRTGKIGVSFYCEYDDPILHTITRRSSSFGEGCYLLRENIGENRVVYQCKVEDAKEYDSLSFIVEWSIID